MELSTLALARTFSSLTWQAACCIRAGGLEEQVLLHSQPPSMRLTSSSARRWFPRDPPSWVPFSLYRHHLTVKPTLLRLHTADAQVMLQGIEWYVLGHQHKPPDSGTLLSPLQWEKRFSTFLKARKRKGRSPVTMTLIRKPWAFISHHHQAITNPVPRHLKGNSGPPLC